MMIRNVPPAGWLRRFTLLRRGTAVLPQIQACSFTSSALHFPADLKYTKGHQWVREEGEVGTVGITNYGNKRLGLGPVVAVHLPQVGASVKRRDVIGAIDFAPATSDFHSPVSGQVLEINSELTDPNKVHLVNEDCFGRGWMFKVKLSNKEELKDLMDGPSYQDLYMKPKKLVKIQVTPEQLAHGHGHHHHHHHHDDDHHHK